MSFGAINPGLFTSSRFSNREEPRFVAVQPIQVDLSVLATPSRSLTDFDAPKPRAFTTPDVRAPWQTRSEAEVNTPLATRAQQARGLRQFVDVNAPEVTRAGDDPDLKATFALFRALENLKALADYAGAKTTPARELAGLNQAFQRGLTEVREFIATQPTDKLKLLSGSKASSLCRRRARRAVFPAKAW
jgi:trimeric autotransporter adhesin